MARIKRRRYECARCHRAGTADEMLFSRWSRKRYCTDLEACARRASHKRVTA